MKNKLLIASLLVALVAPAAQAAGFNLNGNPAPESITLPSLIPPIKTEGGFLGRFRLTLLTNPRSIHLNHGYKFGTRVDSRLFSQVNGPVREEYTANGTTGGNHPCAVPEPDGIALALAAGILGLGFTGYSAHQRRRVLGAA